MIFVRQLQHLLPDAAAWRTTVRRNLRKLLEGLAGAPTDFRAFVDQAWGDVFPTTTRELDAWESQFGIPRGATDSARRAALAGEWSAQGGQSPRYMQDVLHAAGFTNVYVHEWWVPGSEPAIKRDPRAYTNKPKIGTIQCGEPMAVCTPSINTPPMPPTPPPGHDPDSYPPVCNRWLANETDYIVNLDLTRAAPPPVPDDPARWPYFLYFCGQTFGTRGTVPAARRAEFERLLLKIRPQQQWLVTYVTYV